MPTSEQPSPTLHKDDLARLEGDLPPFLTPDDLARLFQTKRSTGYRLAQRIGAIRFGKARLLRVPRGAVMRFLREQEVAAGG